MEGATRRTNVLKDTRKRPGPDSAPLATLDYGSARWVRLDGPNATYSGTKGMFRADRNDDGPVDGVIVVTLEVARRWYLGG